MLAIILFVTIFLSAATFVIQNVLANAPSGVPEGVTLPTHHSDTHTNSSTHSSKTHHSSGHSKYSSSTSGLSNPLPINIRGADFVQIPSKNSDFTNGDMNIVKLVVVHGGNSIDGGWLLRGIVQNVGNKTIPMLTVTATIYDALIQPVDSMQQPAIIGSDTTLAPGQQKPFELYGDAAIGAYFKLGYNW